MISISIVSHGQAGLVQQVVRDILAHCYQPIELLLTVNVPENHGFEALDSRGRVRVIRNKRPKGFGANHNQAFAASAGDWFCVLNPDIRFNADPFDGLLEHARRQRDAVGCIAPLITDPSGNPEDSARRFPTPWRILRKQVGIATGLDYDLTQPELFPDWVGGMFMLIPRAAFQRVGGFDERYFLYYEDVDLCWRLRAAGYQIALATAIAVVHDARRQSHRDWRYLRWHLRSMARYFGTRLPLLRQWLIKGANASL